MERRPRVAQKIYSILLPSTDFTAIYSFPIQSVFAGFVPISRCCCFPNSQKIEIGEFDMAGKIMHAVQYDSYDGGAAALKVFSPFA